MKRILVGVLLSSLFSAASADGIYRKDDSGSVELSNLPDEEGYEEVVRAAPAPRLAAPKASAPTTRAPAAAPTAVVRARATAEEEEAPLAQETRPPADAASEAATTDAAMSGSAVSGVATVMPGGMSNSLSPVSSLSPGLGSPPPVNTVPISDGNQQTPTTPIAQPTPTPILDSPQQLAARLQNYREMMVNESIQASGQPPNPAVVRRYLMTNRATYMANHR